MKYSPVIVVENDVESLCLPGLDRLRQEWPGVQFHYDVEPTVGIPVARNRTIDMALRIKADWIAFIDDDEAVQPGWLNAMHDAILHMDAEAFTGPVEQYLDIERPHWMVVSGPSHHTNGQILKTAATNNTLVDLKWLKKQCSGAGLRFDERLRFTGGSDYEFFYRFNELGGRIRWVSDAVVTEEVPASRLTMQWQVARKLRTRANNARCFLMHKGVVRAYAKYFPAAIQRIVLAGVPLCLAAAFIAPFSRRYAELIWYRGMRHTASGLGTIRGLVGWEPQPYRQIDGY